MADEGAGPEIHELHIELCKESFNEAVEMLALSLADVLEARKTALECLLGDNPAIWDAAVFIAIAKFQRAFGMHVAEQDKRRALTTLCVVATELKVTDPGEFIREFYKRSTGSDPVGLTVSTETKEVVGFDKN